ncbi:protein CASPARIAN STRIP INTEGRITY FACTOR 1-like [Lolium rigidum]|uniref:protein CASPARIAN STRIP INTEGRITY FACTOR 1-like n=1 Tax=Lolium rigidum TaxID=89674 RepID=UPI001F5DDA3A|nr:protein CASPARIAN STRIP INTEGRITY FACTOR 1-like [Lolium rigidum]XP_051220059.1 protein CASPARIAN STRIP INTEGRITY FACTOR 1 [Lolium perenne]
MGMQLRPWKAATLLALFLALLLSTSSAGRHGSFMVDQESIGQQGEGRPVASQGEALAEVHARMLKEVTTSDYGSYDPTPSMEKPHFKLIPN